MKRRNWLLILTGMIEMATGLALLCLPALPIELLLGVEMTAPAALVIAHLAGLAILVIGIICFLARQDQTSPASTGVVTGMLVYNIGAATLLAYAGIGLKLTGLLLWPAVVLHVGLAVWCVGCLRTGHGRETVP